MKLFIFLFLISALMLSHTIRGSPEDLTFTNLVPEATEELVSEIEFKPKEDIAEADFDTEEDLPAEFQACLNSQACQHSVIIFEFCTQPFPGWSDKEIEKAAHECLCNVIFEPWNTTTVICALCLLPSLRNSFATDLTQPHSFSPSSFLNSVSKAINEYCIEGTYLEAFVRTGRYLTLQYHLPVLFWNLSTEWGFESDGVWEEVAVKVGGNL